MDDKHHIKDKEELERIVELMEEKRLISDDELASLMQDKKAMQACRDLFLMKNLVKSRYENVPDVETAWKRFYQKRLMPESLQQPVGQKKSSRFLWGILTGMAASFLIVFFYIIWNGSRFLSNEYVAFQAVDSIQNVILQTSEGERLSLDWNTDENVVKSAGTLLRKKDTLELAYAANVDARIPEEKVEMHRLSTPRGKDFKIILEDGTIVWMNAESSLIYPSKFSSEKRMVCLKGEAYFKVAKNTECPFVISTDRMQVQVLGTELNVRNYVSKDSHVTLINGQVKVFDSTNEENFVLLRPGEDALLNEENAFVVKNIDTESYVYWKEGYFYFDDVPLSEVVQELGRWYNINVIFEKRDLMDLRIRYFCVRSEPLERAIDLLNRMKKMNVRLSGNSVYIR